MKFEKVIAKIRRVTGIKTFVTLTNAYADGRPAGFNQRAVAVVPDVLTGTTYAIRFSDHGRGDTRVGSVSVSRADAKSCPLSDYNPGTYYPTISAALRCLGYVKGI